MTSGNFRSFSDNIRKLRESKGMSQKEFSKYLGVPLSTYATWESGEGGPTVKNRKRLSEILEIPVDQLGEASNARIAAPETGLRRIPVVSWTTAGVAHSYEDLAAQIDEFADSTTKDPNAFAIEVVGDSMMTEVHPGDWVILEPNREASSGDMAYVRLKDEAGGGGTLKWFQRSGPQGRIIKLVPDNPDWPVTEHPIETVLFAYPVGNIHRRRPRKKV